MNDYKIFGSCPVCNAECKFDDDIVVCPECGTPYHRTCYDSVGQCVNKEKHSENFFYKRPSCSQNDAEVNNSTPNSDSSEIKKCPRCFEEIPENSSVCNNCGYQFSSDNKTGTILFNGFPLMPPFDPLFGMDKDETINDLKVSELAQFIRGNLLYYIPVFKSIAEKNKSRFNFSAFLFSGAWFLYRKLYKIGIALTSTTFLLSKISTFIKFTYANDILISIFKSIGLSSLSELTLDKFYLLLNSFYALPMAQKFIVFLPDIIQIINFIIMLVSGFIANKVYYKNSCSKIKKIKTLCKDEQKLYDEEINKFGGVNFKIIPLILLCYIIIEHLPRFLI